MPIKTIDLEGVLAIIDTQEVPAGGFIDVIKEFVARVQEYCLQERDIPQRIRTLGSLAPSFSRLGRESLPAPRRTVFCLPCSRASSR